MARVDELWERVAEVGESFDTFRRADVAGLGEAARRYFEHALAPGVGVARSVEVEMRGRIKLGDGWKPFQGRELLAPSRGFVWRARVGPLGLIRGWDAYVDGDGGLSWKLAGLIPVVRADDADTLRSGVGRALLEAIWLPTALLPSEGAEWLEGPPDVARVALSLNGETVELRLELSPNGSLISVRGDRWCADEGREPGYRAFGGWVEAERTWRGITIPSEIRVGWDFGTDAFDEGEFFRASIVRARFR